MDDEWTAEDTREALSPVMGYLGSAGVRLGDQGAIDRALEEASKGDVDAVKAVLREALRRQDEALIDHLTDVVAEAGDALLRRLGEIGEAHSHLAYLQSNQWLPGQG